MSEEKDPAVLFYTSDFLIGSSGLTMEERGQYITLLCLQHQQGPLTEKQIRLAVGELSEDVRAKFVADEEGRLYNERMALEAVKRAKFVGSRQSNGALGGRPKKPTKNLSVSSRLTYEEPTQNLGENENINENINVNVIKDIVEYLNGVLGANYKFSSGYIQKTITDRLKEGHTFEDFKTVIDKKYAEWHGTEMAKYLRPETLFGPKFERYLQAPAVPIKSGPIIPPQTSFTHDEGMARALMRSYGEEVINDG